MMEMKMKMVLMRRLGDETRVAMENNGPFACESSYKLSN